jgi:hypothetical protein
LGLVTARKTAAGTAATAKRTAPSSSGPKAASPARIAGKAEAQANIVTTIAIVATGSALLPVVGVLSAIVMNLPSRMPVQKTPIRAD